MSSLTVAEVTAALWGKTLRGELDAELAAGLDREFTADREDGRFLLTAVSAAVVARSLDVVRRHRLRGADAIQLATAIAVREADQSVDTLAVFDTRLRRAAAAEGFALLPALVEP